MKFPLSDLHMRVCASAAMIAAAVLPITAGITVDQYGSPYVAYTSYVDFGASSSVAGHLNYLTMSPSEHYRGVAVKYFDIPVYATAQYAPVGKCWEISTFAPAPGINTDTEILVKLPNNPVWQKLSDDYAGTRYSRARFWFGEDFVDPSTIFLRIASYDANSNTGHFMLQASLVRTSANQPILTEADCFTDPGVAAAFVDRVERVSIRRAI